MSNGNDFNQEKSKLEQIKEEYDRQIKRYKQNLTYVLIIAGIAITLLSYAVIDSESFFSYASTWIPMLCIAVFPVNLIFAIVTRRKDKIFFIIGAISLLFILCSFGLAFLVPFIRPYVS